MEKNTSFELNDAIPAYRQIIAYLKSDISSGRLHPGDLLPTEMSLCESFGVSRTTVRQAFQILEREGYIIRRRGKGTFVCEQKLKRSLNNYYNFTAEMRMLGLKPSSRVLRFEVIKPDPDLCGKLQIHESEPVYRIKRLRIANDIPLLLETAYIPVRFCPNLTEEDLTDSLYASISNHTGASPLKASEIYEAVVLREKDALLLDCSSGAPALRICRTSINSFNEIFEYTIIIARGDRNAYQVTLNRNNVEFGRDIHKL